MNDETDMPMPMSDGEMSGDKPDTKPSKDGKRTYEKPLKIRGSLDDALRVLVHQAASSQWFSQGLSVEKYLIS